MRDCTGIYFILNREILPTEKFDKSGFMGGVILYEVIAFHNRKYLYLEDHLERFEASSRMADLSLWMPKDELRSFLLKLLEINIIDTGSINVVFNFTRNNTFVTYINVPGYPSEADYQQGVRAQLHFDIRTTPNIKFFLQDFRERAGKRIAENNLWEVILVDRNDFITEASRSNVFMIRDGQVITAPVELVLPGVTRKHVIRLLKKMGFSVTEKCVKYTELNNMDAVFLTGTTSRILPVRTIDERVFNPGHPIITRLIRAYEQEIARECQ